MNDLYGESYNLYYIRTKEGFEIDFQVTGEKHSELLLEVKWGDDKPSRNFSRFATYFPNSRKVQIVKELTREKTFPDGLEIRKAHSWLANLWLNNEKE